MGLPVMGQFWGTYNPPVKMYTFMKKLVLLDMRMG